MTLLFLLLFSCSLFFSLPLLLFLTYTLLLFLSTPMAFPACKVFSFLFFSSSYREHYLSAYLAPIFRRSVRESMRTKYFAFEFFVSLPRVALAADIFESKLRFHISPANSVELEGPWGESRDVTLYRLLPYLDARLLTVVLHVHAWRGACFAII